MKRISILLLAATSFAVPACSNDGTTKVPGSGDDDGSGSGSGSSDPYAQMLAARVVDYPAALRIAAVRLTGDLPSLDEITSVAVADPTAAKTAYEGLIDTYMGRPTFAKQMFAFWQDQMKIGGSTLFDTAPAFAAQLTVNNGDYRQLFTAATNTCPTFDGTSTFTAASCANNAPTSGVLSDPGVMSSFTSNLAFRRVRWVQEVFDCLSFPVQDTGTPVDEGGAAPYLGAFPFSSIASPMNGGGRVNFQDTSSTICANCHHIINHRAPLFGNFDANGMYQTTIAVTVPLDGAPLAKITDWLPPGETTAWLYGVPAATLPAFGAAMAADTGVQACGIARVWNWALGKQDIVDSLETVPSATIQDEMTAFTSNGFKVKDLISMIYKSTDFVSF